MSANKELEIKTYAHHEAKDHKASLNTNFLKLESTIQQKKEHSINAIKGKMKKCK